MRCIIRVNMKTIIQGRSYEPFLYTGFALAQGYAHAQRNTDPVNLKFYL